MSTALLLLCGTCAAFQGPMTVRQAASPATGQQARAAEVTMGATIRELRDRVGSVKNTKKITSAMKLVAAAKVRRAQEAVLRSRPFSETLERILGGLLQRLKTESLDIPLLEARAAKKVGLVVITGDRGLCGSYNAAAIKKAEARIAELKEQASRAERTSPLPYVDTLCTLSRPPAAPRAAACAYRACTRTPTAVTLGSLVVGLPACADAEC